VEKYSSDGQATDDIMAHVHFTLSTLGYKHTLSEYIIVIGFLLQQWLHQHASMLRYAYVVYLLFAFWTLPFV